METKLIKIIIKNPYQQFEIKQIVNEFSVLKKIIECQTVEFCPFPLDNSIQMLVNEDGKILQLDGNFMVPEFKDCIVGPCIFASCDSEGEIIGLNDNQIKKISKYLKDFELHKGENIYEQCDFLIDKAKRKMVKNQEGELW